MTSEIQRLAAAVAVLGKSGSGPQGSILRAEQQLRRNAEAVAAMPRTGDIVSRLEGARDGMERSRTTMDIFSKSATDFANRLAATDGSR